MKITPDHFDIASAIKYIKQYQYTTVTLQFPDELLPYSISIYNEFLARSKGLLSSSECDTEIMYYITADSTYGVSIDDISAAHIDSQLLIYFGSDLSSSSSQMAVLILPLQKLPTDMYDEYHHLISYASIADHVNLETSGNYPFHQQIIEALQLQSSQSILVLYEASYHRYVNYLQQYLHNNENHITIGKLPSTADMSSWRPCDNAIPIGFGRLGGLLVNEELINDHSTEIIYIGDKYEQLSSVMLRMSAANIQWFQPIALEMIPIRGCDSKDFRERYGGVSKVKDASVIGLIVGSMGLSEDQTKDIITKLTMLVETARKKCLVLVMGRINEAKLCNFPEVDVYCLITNEDMALIKPKTFHVPVITPFELELGLGARDWESFYRLDIDAYVTNLDVQSAIEKVKEYFIDEFNEDSQSDEDEAATEDVTGTGGSVVKSAGGNQLVSYQNNTFIEKFEQREYKGLIPQVEADTSTEIQKAAIGPQQQ